MVHQKNRKEFQYPDSKFYLIDELGDFDHNYKLIWSIDAQNKQRFNNNQIKGCEARKRELKDRKRENESRKETCWRRPERSWKSCASGLPCSAIEKPFLSSPPILYILFVSGPFMRLMLAFQFCDYLMRLIKARVCSRPISLKVCILFMINY